MTARRLNFVHKDAFAVEYQRTFGAYLQQLKAYEDEYGEPFDPEDPDIPDAHRAYYRLQGMRSAIKVESHPLLTVLHAGVIGDDAELAAQLPDFEEGNNK